MHYAHNAFAIDQESPSILPFHKASIGNRKVLSLFDVKRISLLYKCTEKLVKVGPATTTMTKKTTSKTTRTTSTTTTSPVQETTSELVEETGAPETDDATTRIPILETTNLATSPALGSGKT